MQEHDRIYVGGRWVPSRGTGRIPVVEAASEEVIGTVPEGMPADVEAAVVAAAEAFPEWAATLPAERAAACTRIAKGLESRKDELATLISREVGMVRFLSELVQVGLPIHSFGAVTGVVEQFAWEEQIGSSLVVREPIGVVGCITPWNYPLHQIAAKVAFALGAGCTVVLKPSEVAPLNAYVLAEVIDDAGLPAGVFNMVSGTGPVVGEALASHPLVDMVSFTGSTRAGKRVGELCMQRVAKVALELGGKSANVLLPDADFARAVPDGVGKAFLNSGQTCSALTRMLVPRDRLAEVEELAARAAEALTVGDPLAEGSRLGPLASAAQWERVQGYIRSGIEEGAKLVTGGPGRPEGLDRGFYARPTVFSEVAPGMRIAQEEIFGPVLAILPYDDEDQALEIANGTIYGLAGGVWAGREERALAFARRLRTGQVEVNGGAFNPDAPFGGYKQSGIGREYGRFGLEEFLEVKSIQR